MKLFFLLLLLPSLLIANDKPVTFTVSIYGNYLDSLEPEVQKDPHSMMGVKIVRKCTLVKEAEGYKVVLDKAIYSKKTNEPVSEVQIEDSRIAGTLKWLLQMEADQIFRIVPRDKSSKEQGSDFYTVSPNDPTAKKTSELPMYRRAKSFMIYFDNDGVGKFHVHSEGIVTPNGGVDAGNGVHSTNYSLDQFVDPNNEVLFMNLNDPVVQADIKIIYEAELRSMSRQEQSLAFFMGQAGIEITDDPSWWKPCIATLGKL